MLKRMKLLITKIMAPTQNLKISLFGNSSELSTGVGATLLFVKNFLILASHPVFCWGVTLVLLLLSVFFVVFVFAIRRFGFSSANLVEKNVNSEHLLFFFIILYSINPN